MNWYYSQTSNIRHTFVGNEIVDHSDVVGASLVGAAPTTSSFSTEHLASIYCTKTTARWDKKHLSFGIWCFLYQKFNGIQLSMKLRSFWFYLYQSSLNLTYCNIQLGAIITVQYHMMMHALLQWLRQNINQSLNTWKKHSYLTLIDDVWGVFFVRVLEKISQRYTGLILGLHPANERRRYKVTPSLIGRAQT